MLNADNGLIMVVSVNVIGAGQTRTESLICVFIRFRNGVVCWENILDQRQVTTDKHRILPFSY